ncbi:MAG: hypothetical protein ABUT20_24695 [Bacteroidota bacterium]
MYYFAVTYTAKINGTKTETGTAGIESKSNDFVANKVKEKVRDHYKQSDSSIRTVGVVLTGHEKLDQPEYEKLKQDFLLLIGR